MGNFTFRSALCIAFIATIITTTTLTGCGNKIEQCNQTIDLVNSHLTKMSALNFNSSDGNAMAKSMKDASTAISNLKKEMAALSPSDEKIKSFNTEYMKLLDSSVSIATKTAQLIETVTPLEESSAAKQKKVEETIENLSKACSEPKVNRKVCQELINNVNGVLNSLNRDEEKNPSLDKMKAIEITDEKVKPVAAQFITLAGELTADRVKYKKSKAEVDALMEEWDKVNQQESKLVDEFNAYCQSL